MQQSSSMFRIRKGKIFAWRSLVLSVVRRTANTYLWKHFALLEFFLVQMNGFAHPWSCLLDLMYANLVEFNSVSKPANKNILYMRPRHI